MMELDRATLLRLLPCYACGDLPPPAARAVERALAADPDLRARAEALVLTRETCARALAEAAGDLAALGLPPVGS